MRRETIHRMTRRRNGWDYCAPGRYMVTLALSDRSRPWLGALIFGGNRPPGIVPTPLGDLVAALWRELPALFPGVVVEEFVLMPDHLHGILRLATRQKHPLGQIVGAFKARSTGAARNLAGKPASTIPAPVPGTAPASPGAPAPGIVPASPGAPAPGIVPASPGAVVPGIAPASPGAVVPGIVPASLLAGSSLWAPGLTDSILYSEERRRRAVAYIADNPRRLAEKRLHPGLFTVRQDLVLPLPLGPGGAEIPAHFSAIGNEALLRRLDFHQVQCSRRFFAYRRDPYGNPLPDEPPVRETPEFAEASDLAVSMAAEGAVAVCPCISQGEREIARRLYKTDAAMIVLKNKGFPPLYKPEGALFSRCAAGRLLMLAPASWPFIPGRREMTRGDACALNRIAQAIAREGAAEIDYRGMAPADIDRLAREAVGAAPAS